VQLFDAILDHMGIAAQRSNSIFTTSSIDHADEYGDHIYVIIPTNSAKFSWSQTKEDIVLTRSLLWRSAYRTQTPNYTANELKQLKNEVEKELKIAERQPDVLPDGDLDRAKANKVFLLNQIKTSGYAVTDLLNYDLGIMGMYSLQERIMSNTDLMLRNTNIQKVQEEYQITDKNFEEALQLGHEVLIHGEYYAIEHDLYESFKFW
jgi:hypothetical protein